MSIVATSLPSCAYIYGVIMIASSDTIVDAASSLFMHECFFLPSAHVIPLILPPLFLLGESGMLAHLPCPSWSVYYHLEVQISPSRITALSLSSLNFPPLPISV